MLYIILSVSIIVFICIILFFMRSPKNKENKNSSSNTNKDKKKFIIYGSLDLTNIKLPSKIKENISSEDVVKSVAEFYKVFKSLDYIKKDINELETKLEWNSWEISQFLYLLQLNRNILMPDCKKILHESILKFTKEQVINEMKYIILKYNKSTSKDELFLLKNQLIWSAKEVSFIFYYLSLIKEMSDKNLDI